MGTKYAQTASKIWYGKEEDWANTTTPDSYFGVVQSFNFDETNEIIDVYQIGNRSPEDNIYGQYSISGSIDFLASDLDIFEIIFGSVSGSGTESDPYTYSTSNTLPSITIEGGSDANSGTAQGATISGAKCSSASISMDLGEPVNVSTQWIAKKPENIDSFTEGYTIPSQAPWTFIQGAFKRDGDSVGIVQNVTLNIENGIIEVRDVGSRLLHSALAGQLGFTFDCTVVLDSDLTSTILKDFYGQTANSGPVDNGHGSITGETFTFELDDGNDRNLTITLNNTTINDINRSGESGSNFRSLSFSGKFRSISVTEQRNA
ncbi:MAG: phage tail tube protein [Nanoarchaeota archaeon]